MGQGKECLSGWSWVVGEMEMEMDAWLVGSKGGLIWVSLLERGALGYWELTSYDTVLVLSLLFPGSRNRRGNLVLTPRSSIESGV